MNRKGHGGSGLIALIPALIGMGMTLPYTFPLMLMDWCRFVAIPLEIFWICVIIYGMYREHKEKSHWLIGFTIVWWILIGLVLGSAFLIASST